MFYRYDNNIMCLTHRLWRVKSLFPSMFILTELLLDIQLLPNKTTNSPRVFLKKNASLMPRNPHGFPRRRAVGNLRVRKGRETVGRSWGIVKLEKRMRGEKLQWLPSPKLTARPWKWMVGILLSFWEGLFSGAMLVSGSVPPPKWFPYCSELIEG